MAVPNASDNLHSYHTWRKELTTLPPETIVRWIDEKKLPGATVSDDIKRGQTFMLGKTRRGMFSHDATEASMVYLATQCSRNGKLFKRSWRPTVEGVAGWLENGQLEIIVPNPNPNE